ncbi:MAG TPA: ECF transporter S component [Firmicutes bacterium]|nr:ECF transporter S component [Bacillota bacterium]
MCDRNNKKVTVKLITFVGLLAALVCVASGLRIQFPTPVGTGAVHFGNIFCLLSGLLLGGPWGGVAAGLGSCIYDLLSNYASSAPFTLIFKFVMAYVCGLIAHRSVTSSEKSTAYSTVIRYVLAGVAGQVAYIILYCGKSFLSAIWFKQVELETALIDTAAKGAASGINAIIAVAISVPLYLVLKKALIKAGMEDALHLA